MLLERRLQLQMLARRRAETCQVRSHDHDAGTDAGTHGVANTSADAESYHGTNTRADAVANIGTDTGTHDARADTRAHHARADARTHVFRVSAPF